MWIILSPEDEAVGPFNSQEEATDYGLSKWPGDDSWDVMKLRRA